MATQTERREATRAAIVDKARKCFGDLGYATATIDLIADQAGVAKGAVYHHFSTKKALFETVLEEVSEEISCNVQKVVFKESDILKGMSKGIAKFFELCAPVDVATILLKDGPAILGWERWREIDGRHFGGGVLMALTAAMDVGAIRKQPVEPLTQLMLGAISEAAMDCASRKNFKKAAKDYIAGLEAILDGLKTGSG